MESKYQTASDRFIHFCTANSTVSLHLTMGHSFPRQNCPFQRGDWTPSNTWFLRPTQVLKPNSISIGSVVFAGLTTVTDRPTYKYKPIDRQTDHATQSVTICHMYIRSTAMQPKVFLYRKNRQISFSSVHTCMYVHIYTRPGLVLKPKPKSRFWGETEPKLKLRFWRGSKSVLRPHWANGRCGWQCEWRGF